MSDPKTSNDPKVIARLLRTIATGDNPHWKLLNAAADLLDGAPGEPQAARGSQHD